MNIIFTVQRPYHLLISNAYAEYIYNTYGLKSTFVISRFNPGSYKADYADIIQLPCKLPETRLRRAVNRLVYGGWLFPFNKVARKIDFRQKSILFVFTDLEPISDKLIRVLKKKSKSNIVVLIDEGVGTYSETNAVKKTFIRSIKKIVTALIGAETQTRAIGDNKNIDYAIVGNPEKYANLKKSQGQTIIKQNKDRVFRNSKTFVQNYIGRNLTPNVSRTAVVYLGQPFNEFGGFTSTEFEFLGVLFDMIPKDIRIIIKPHSAEARDKYDEIVKSFENVSLINQDLYDIPVECLVGGIIHAHSVMSYISSAGINIANIFPDVKSVFLFRMDKASKLAHESTFTNEIINDGIFSSPYNNIFIPKTANDLLAILSNGNADNGISVEQGPCETVYPEIDILMK